MRVYQASPILTKGAAVIRSFQSFHLFEEKDCICREGKTIVVRSLEGFLLFEVEKD